MTEISSTLPSNTPTVKTRDEDKGQQELESPKRRKTSHPSADEETNQDDSLETAYKSEQSGDLVVEDGKYDGPRPNPSVSEATSDATMEERSYGVDRLFGDTDEDKAASHASTPVLGSSSPVFGVSPPSSEHGANESDKAEAPGPGIAKLYMVDALPAWTQPRKLTRSMSMDRHDQFQREPTIPLWQSLKRAISHRGDWWNDPSKPDRGSQHDVAQRSCSVWRNRDDPFSFNHHTADMALDVVPYFRRQVEMEGRTAHDALYKTEICIDEERGLKVTLEQLLNLVPGGIDSWLTDTVMETLVHLIAPPRMLRMRGRQAWFCTDAMIQLWCAAIDPSKHLTVADMDKLILEERKTSCLPARDIPPDAESMVFFSNRSEGHWKTVLAWVDGNTNRGHVCICNSWGNTSQNGNPALGHRGQDEHSLRRLMLCIALESPNELFRNADWAYNGWVGNIDCPQQVGTDDCGVFAVNAALSLLCDGDVQLGWYNTNYAYREAHGLCLRRNYMGALKRSLDMRSIGIETRAEMVRNRGRRWSVSGERTDGGLVI